MLSIFRHMMKNEEGVTAIEYSLIAALIAIAAVTMMGYAGKGISNTLSNVADALK